MFLKFLISIIIIISFFLGRFWERNFFVKQEKKIAREIHNDEDSDASVPLAFVDKKKKKANISSQEKKSLVVSDILKFVYANQAKKSWQIFSDLIENKASRSWVNPFVQDLYSKLKKNQFVNEIESFTKLILESDYSDSNFFVLQAEIDLTHERWLNAFKAYYQAYQVSDERLQAENILITIHKLEERIYQRYSEQKKYSRLIKLYDFLLKEENFSTYRYHYLLTLFFLGNYLKVLSESELMLGDEVYAEKILRIRQKAETLSVFQGRTDQTVKIPLKKERNHYFVEAMINSNVEARLMLDTGASYTVVTAKIFRKIIPDHVSVNSLKKMRFQTASGPMESPLYKVKKFQVERVPVADFLIAGALQAGEGMDGVVGMNFLGLFRFEIDTQNNFLILRPKLKEEF